MTQNSGSADPGKEYRAAKGNLRFDAEQCLRARRHDIATAEDAAAETIGDPRETRYTNTSARMNNYQSRTTYSNKPRHDRSRTRRDIHDRRIPRTEFGIGSGVRTRDPKESATDVGNGRRHGLYASPRSTAPKCRREHDGRGWDKGTRVSSATAATATIVTRPRRKTGTVTQHDHGAQRSTKTRVLVPGQALVEGKSQRYA